jgi:hypothetical protein
MMYVIIILLILLAISIYANINSLKTIDVLEKEIETFSDEFIRIRAIVIDMRNELKAIDRRGSFEADDEVGIFFKNLKTIILRLDELFKT